MHTSWLSLIPFLLIIPLSIWTRQVQPGLFLALLVGSYLVDPSLFGGIQKFLSYLFNVLVKPNNLKIILFLYSFSGMLYLIRSSGGIKGFVTWVQTKIKTPKGALILVWLSTFGTFSDPDFRIVTISPIIKALQERFNLSKWRVAYIIDVTSNPVVALVPIATAFVGYMVSLIHTSFKQNGITRDPYITYIQSIPFNFFSLAILLVGLYFTFFSHSIRGDASEQTQPIHKETDPDLLMNKKLGVPSAKMSSKLTTYKLQPQAFKNHGTNDRIAFGEEYAQPFDANLSTQKSETDIPNRPWNLLLPIFLLISLTLFLSWWTGRAGAHSVTDAFLRANELNVMLDSVLISLIATISLLLVQRIPVNQIVTNFINGGNQLMSVIILLVLIWGVSDVSDDLGFSSFITQHLSGWIPPHFVSPILFLMGIFISYFIGSSWGTWGLLMPLGITLAHQSGANLLLVIGAVFASGTFGATCSPLSDNTVTLCTMMDMPVMDYCKWKLWPTSIAAGMALLLFVIASLVF